MKRYLGVDVGGKDNTWMAVIEEDEGKPRVKSPTGVTLTEIVKACQKPETLAVAIDAQLTFSISRENGFRSSDLQLRDLLHKDFRHRVMAYNCLMAVPLRGSALATAVAPFVGTIIETHPTACLLLAFEGNSSVSEAVCNYKGSQGEEIRRRACECLWGRWTAEFEITEPPPKGINDGHVDALVTATVAWLYHKSPERLRKLGVGDGENDEVGRGSFWVVGSAS